MFKNGAWEAVVRRIKSEKGTGNISYNLYKG